MSQVQICDNCGARIEIEDTDALEAGNETLPEEDENPQENVLCENCTHQAMLNKI